MTIFTKSADDAAAAEKKTLEKQGVVLDAEENDGASASPRSGTLYDDLTYRQSVAEWYFALRRRRMLTSLCATLLIIWLLLAAVAGSILLFKYIHRKPVYYGWCGADYVDHDSKAERLRERVEIDPENDLEKIEVPQFGSYRPGLFIHDFRQNLTAIIDVLGEQCFIKPLDRRQTAPPTGFMDLMRKVDSGYYDQSAALIRERFVVVFPELTPNGLRNLGSWVITQQCRSMRTYMLQKAPLLATTKRYRRSELRRMKLNFIYYNGNGLVVKESIRM